MASGSVCAAVPQHYHWHWPGNNKKPGCVRYTCQPPSLKIQIMLKKLQVKQAPYCMGFGAMRAKSVTPFTAATIGVRVEKIMIFLIKKIGFFY